MSSRNRFAVIDFETTGLSPNKGARMTEVAVVMVENGAIVDTYQSLAKTGAWIPSEIERLTGITNAMVEKAPSANKVMADVYKFVASSTPVAHNAAFDKQFWNAEMELAQCPGRDDFLCTMLLSRRLYPKANDHKLGTLADFHSLKRNGNSHRALSDAELTAKLFLKICQDAKSGLNLPDVNAETLGRVLKNGASIAPPKTSTGRAPATSTVNAAFMAALRPSSALAQIVGANPLPRTEVVSLLWAYIKKHDLQDKVNKRMINADDRLAAVFGKRQVTMFEMAGLIGSHLK
jgi:DNA polymerase-3 subunit epsilon